MEVISEINFKGEYGIGCGWFDLIIEYKYFVF